MKLTAKYKTKIIDSTNHAHLTLLIENYRQVGYLNELEPDMEYTIEIKPAKSKRSIAQNSFLWALLHELELATKQDMMEWYCYALEESNAQYEYILGIDGIEKQLMNAFRAVRKIGKRMVKDKEVMMYKCYYGSSRFTIKEMNELLDTVLRYCAEHNIDTEALKYDTV